ncbi:MULTISPECIES: SDR family NAD(P)-dependent oxidoreductase [Glutamicibacter]|uniref:Short subunit dehydrogenase n=1 Tax=Glutamicibacter mysorens TaxID=257984 RepID=A0ABX4MXQ8_9MICC|nr:MULTISPECIES: SDR family oxidoreductase [Glutamicibacter]PJJ44152.1 short subunit dehydrogenase [Glutamicibacter mysorens]UTM46931.1 SDR family oxidoreductase [Glutamicibacter mysorens]WIV42710.1 SDR family oxidoreductase [Glutamicibacter nicotianae]
MSRESISLNETSKLVLLAGATSASGIASATALVDAGARVLAVGSNQDRLDERLPFVHARYECDLGDFAAVKQLALQVHEEHGSIDALIHLVGGWRGGKSITGQSDEDWEFLHHSVLTTLRNTSRAFVDDLVSSPAGRLAIVSAEAVLNPTPSNANYGAIKAAAEHWVNAIARLFAKQAENAAAVSWVVKALSDKSPEEAPSGHTPVQFLAQAAVDLLEQDAGEFNGARIALPKA